MTRAAIRLFLRRATAHIRADKVVFTDYAVRRAAEELGWDRHDILLQLQDLRPEDFLRTEYGILYPDKLVWIFQPEYWEGGRLWIRLIETDKLIVISFHRENTHET